MVNKTNEMAMENEESSFWGASRKRQVGLWAVVWAKIYHFIFLDKSNVHSLVSFDFFKL